MEWFIVCLLAWGVSIVAGDYVARQKGRTGTEGAVFGLIFGPLGVLIVACLPEAIPVPERRTKSKMMPWSIKRL